METTSMTGSARAAWPPRSSTPRRTVGGAAGQAGHPSGTPSSRLASTPPCSSPATIIALGSSVWALSASKSNGLPGRMPKSSNDADLMAPVCPCQPSCAAPLTVWDGRDWSREPKLDPWNCNDRVAWWEIATTRNSSGFQVTGRGIVSSGFRPVNSGPKSPTKSQSESARDQSHLAIAR